MMTLPNAYSLRPATPEDAAVIASQRGQMFVDMGSMTPEEVALNGALWTDWLKDAMAAGEYVAFLVEHSGRLVAGVGLMFMPRIPTHGDPGRVKGHVLNMSVDPAHRRRGLAEVLMRAALAECRSRGIKSVSLNAAPMGRRIYERLGFVESTSPEMRLSLDEPC